MRPVRGVWAQLLLAPVEELAASVAVWALPLGAHGVAKVLDRLRFGHFSQPTFGSPFGVFSSTLNVMSYSL